MHGPEALRAADFIDSVEVTSYREAAASKEASEGVMRFLSSTALLGACALVLFAVANSIPASAIPCNVYCYVTADDKTDDVTLFMNGSTGNTGVTSFSGSADKNNNFDNVDFTTNGPVTHGNGNANIKGVDSTFTDITLTPHGKFSFDGVLFRGQINDVTPKKGNTPGSYDGTLKATVTDKSGKVFDLSWSGISSNGDFTTRGFDEGLGRGDPIKSVKFSLGGTGGYFFQFKQLDVSTFSAVTPLPASWTMMLIGFAGLGFLCCRRQKQQNAALSAG
jgi:hypothetical protein